MAFKQLADILSTLSSLRRKRRTKGESNDFALTGPEILWLKWPRGSRQIWQSVSFWVELLLNHSFLLNCRNAFSLNWAICSWCSLSPAAGMHVGRWLYAVRLLLQLRWVCPPKAFFLFVLLIWDLAAGIVLHEKIRRQLKLGLTLYGDKNMVVFYSRRM